MNSNIPSMKVKMLAQHKKPIQRQESFSSLINENSQQSSKSFRSKDPVLENTPINLNILHKDKHTKLNINNVDIYFPHKPYDVQVVYMESVIKCLQEKVHGLLESPTGTGKTLSMLCACLGWLQQRREQTQGIKDVIPNRIIYCSRTHSQIQQVVKEIKTTAYQPKIIVQGSREQYCIKKEFQQLKGGLLNTSCQKAISQLNTQTYCKYFRGTMDDSRDVFKLRMPDIEDLRSDGYNNNYCPFYHTQKVNNAVDVLFLPYNYLLDRNVMNQANINIKNAVIIFDEAHNIHKSAEEGYSLFLNYSSLCAAEADLLNLLKYIETGHVDDQNNAGSTAPLLGAAKRGTQIKELSDFDTKNFASCTFDCKAMLGPIQELRNYFKQKALQQIKENQQNQYREYNSDNIQIQNGKDIFQLIQIHTRSSKEGVNENSIDNYIKALEKQKGQQFVSFENGLNQTNLGQYIDRANKAIKDLSIGASHHGLETWVKFLEGLKDLWTSHNEFNLKTKKSDNPTQLCQNTDVMQDYKLYFDLEDPENPQLNLSCLNPSLNFKKILQLEPHCLLFTSGTLKPFNFWKTELQIPFNVVLENKHVIDSKKQLFSAVIKGRPQNSSVVTQYKKTFNFCYEKRKDQDMILDLGNALVELFQIIPNGVLIVFPSNQLMNQCKAQWSNFFSNSNANNSQKIYNRMLAQKFIYWEAKTNAETMSAMQDFKQKSKTQKGSAFFCVARGKITEGIDFADESARAVILVGLPYPPLKNINIQVKKDYLNQQCKTNSQRINGNEWYVQEAIRAMNQSIGRVIRHINDWGSVIFLDERFGQQDILKHMPSWCLTQQIDSFDQALIQLSQFFNEKKQLSKQKQEEQKRQFALKKKLNFEQDLDDSNSNIQNQQSSGAIGVQKRAFDFTSIKNQQNQIQKPQKFFKQNSLVSSDQEQQKSQQIIEKPQPLMKKAFKTLTFDNKEKQGQKQFQIPRSLQQPEKSQQIIEKPAQTANKNPFENILSDDEGDLQLEQFQTVKPSNFVKPENKEDSSANKFDFSKPIKIKSFAFNKVKTNNSPSNFSNQQNVISTKNSIYSNKIFFE